MNNKNHAERIYHEWDRTWANHDLEAFLALYAEDAIVESPVIQHVMGGESGICKGKEALRHVVPTIRARTPTHIRGFYRTGYFSNDHQVIWEYPRLTPHGEQMDFVEVLDLNEEGLICYHRIYWGWRGVKILQDDEYHHTEKSNVPR